MIHIKKIIFIVLLLLNFTLASCKEQEVDLDPLQTEYQTMHGSYLRDTDKIIDGYKLYVTDIERNLDTMCEESSINYTVIYFTEFREYTTNDLYYGCGSHGNFYIIFENEVINLYQAVNQGILDSESVINFNYDVNVIVRDKYDFKDNITDIKVFDHDVEILNVKSSTHYNTFILIFDFYTFTTQEYNPSNYMYTIKIITDTSENTYEIYDDYILYVENGKIAHRHDYGWATIQYDMEELINNIPID